MARVYSRERGAPRPEGDDAITLVADQVLREHLQGRAATAAAWDIYLLWAASDCRLEQLADLASFDDTFTLIEQGILTLTVDEASAQFSAAAAELLAQGGARRSARRSAVDG